MASIRLRTDDEIANTILEALAREGLRGSIRVSVHRGLVVLAGGVATAEERREATRIAHRAGALLVRNDLVPGHRLAHLQPRPAPGTQASRTRA